MSRQGRGRVEEEKARRWAGLIEGWAKVGGQVRAYCRAQGCSEAGFYWWRRELARRGVSRQGASAAFRELKIRADTPAAQAECGEDAGVEVLVRGQRRVRLARGFDPQSLREAVAALEAMA